MAKYKFEVLEGKHALGSVTYKKGDFIDTDVDLVASLPKRFRKIQTFEEMKSELTARATPPNGNGDAKTVSTATTVTAEATVEPKKITLKKGKVDDTVLAARGTDVTKKFKGVDGKLLRVFQRGEFFHVYEPMGVTAINKNGLKEKEVGKFCKEYLEE